MYKKILEGKDREKPLNLPKDIHSIGRIIHNPTILTMSHAY